MHWNGDRESIIKGAGLYLEIKLKDFELVVKHQLKPIEGLLNSFRDGNGLNCWQLVNISDAILMVCRCTWANHLCWLFLSTNFQPLRSPFKKLLCIFLTVLVWIWIVLYSHFERYACQNERPTWIEFSPSQIHSYEGDSRGKSTSRSSLVRNHLR